MALDLIRYVLGQPPQGYEILEYMLGGIVAISLINLFYDMFPTIFKFFRDK